LTYAKDESIPTAIPLPVQHKHAPENTGFEAFARAPDGAYVAISEGSRNLRDPFAVFELSEGDDWKVIYHLQRSGGFRPVGADFGPDGHLYVLSRGFNGFSFAAQIARLTYEDGKPVAYEKLFDGAFGQFDNLEGIAVWKPENGALRIVAISDDNFSDFQSTLVVEFSLTE